MTSYFVNNEWTKHDENIWEAKNFVDDKSCQDLINYIKLKDTSCAIHSNEHHFPEDNKNSGAFSWEPSCFGNVDSSSPLGDYSTFDGIRLLIHSIEDAAARYTTQSMRLAKVVVHTYAPGSSSPEHSDIYPLATLLYLNDDYEGGELNFPKQKIDIRPDKGSLLSFKGGTGYTHQVKQINGNNPRYVLVAFWDYEDENSLEEFWTEENTSYQDAQAKSVAESKRLKSLDPENCNVLYPLTFPILEVKDFVTPREAELITEFLNINDVPNNECWGAPCFKEYWAVQHKGEPVDIVYPEGIDENTISELNDRIRKVVEHFLDTDQIVFSKLKGHDIITGAFAPPHHHEPALAQADLMLSGGYEGGKTYFPTLNIEFTPNAYSLYVYVEDGKFKHGVTEVTSGNRYHIASHWQPVWHEYRNAGANI